MSDNKKNNLLNKIILIGRPISNKSIVQNFTRHGARNETFYRKENKNRNGEYFLIHIGLKQIYFLVSTILTLTSLVSRQLLHHCFFCTYYNVPN